MSGAPALAPAAPHRRRASCPWPLLTPAQLEADTPSRRAGVPAARERKFYRNLYTLVRDGGAALGLSQPTTATALLFGFRYFAVRSFSKSDRFIVGTAALFLAAKARDELRPLDAVVAACVRARGGGKDGGAAPAPPLADPAHAAALRDAVLTAERALLYALGFELDLELPHEALLRALALLRASDDAAVAAFWGDAKHTQLALNFINDSFRTTLCLTHDWAHIGAGAVQAVVELAGGPPPLVAGGAPFWQVATDDLAQDTLDAIVATITGMYTTDGGGGGGGGGGKGKARDRGGDRGGDARPAKAAKAGAGQGAGGAAAAAAARQGGSRAARAQRRRPPRPPPCPPPPPPPLQQPPLTPRPARPRPGRRRRPRSAATAARRRPRRPRARRRPRRALGRRRRAWPAWSRARSAAAAAAVAREVGGQRGSVFFLVSALGRTRTLYLHGWVDALDATGRGHGRRPAWCARSLARLRTRRGRSLSAPARRAGRARLAGALLARPLPPPPSLHQPCPPPPPSPPAPRAWPPAAPAAPRRAAARPSRPPRRSSCPPSRPP